MVPGAPRSEPGAGILSPLEVGGNESSTAPVGGSGSTLIAAHVPASLSSIGSRLGEPP